MAEILGFESEFSCVRNGELVFLELLLLIELDKCKSAFEISVDI
jgi:hypothetical protein